MSTRPTDEDIPKMSDCLDNISLPGDPVPTRCLFLGRHCSSVHIIDVPPIYPATHAQTHLDLDIFKWSVGMPHYTETYIDLDSNRVSLSFKLLGNMERYKADYVVMHFDQNDSDLFIPTQKQNMALSSIIEKEHLLWHGDILVAKHNISDGRVVDVLPSDVVDITDLLTDAILKGRMV